MNMIHNAFKENRWNHDKYQDLDVQSTRLVYGFKARTRKISYLNPLKIADCHATSIRINVRQYYNSFL